MIKFNEVTWYSKLAAIIFFIGALPALAFYIGEKYQEASDAGNVHEFHIDPPTEMQATSTLKK